MLYNILIVDDEKYTLEDIEMSLNREQLHIGTVFTSLNITKARNILETEKVHIVLSDIDMPGGNGLQLIRYIQDNFPDMPCILITCHADFTYAQEAVRLHCQNYLLKPVDYDILAEEIRKAEAQVDKALNNSVKYSSYRHLSNRIQKVHDSIQTVQQNYIELAVEYIEKNITNDIKREEVANCVHLSPDHLDRLFREQFGMSVYKYISNKKIALAEDLLTNTNLPISTISSNLGFSNMSNFSLAFKKANGITPNDYRKRKSKTATEKS